MVVVLEGKGVLKDVWPASCGELVRSSWVGGLYRGAKKTQVARRPTRWTVCRSRVGGWHGGSVRCMILVLQGRCYLGMGAPDSRVSIP
ncbi:hypothetical protein CRG98_034625 [Punica granatum]|uniref:Uncharacterized protein n=1 Tax=Punica granatum TaxID=22663 RepID=A0A2I0INM5_PUNGR|nr:hypothetical protein CRG98_034625 [Punica granatum]